MIALLVFDQTGVVAWLLLALIVLAIVWIVRHL